jgi:inner membrane protein involved in colicin E2 resistance
MCKDFLAKSRKMSSHDAIVIVRVEPASAYHQEPQALEYGLQFIELLHCVFHLQN